MQDPQERPDVKFQETDTLRRNLACGAYFLVDSHTVSIGLGPRERPPPPSLDLITLPDDLCTSDAGDHNLSPCHVKRLRRQSDSNIAVPPHHLPHQMKCLSTADRATTHHMRGARFAIHMGRLHNVHSRFSHWMFESHLRIWWPRADTRLRLSQQAPTLSLHAHRPLEDRALRHRGAKRC